MQGGIFLQIQDLKNMKVVELKKFAKENGIKLASGLLKDEIVQQIYKECSKENTEPSNTVENSTLENTQQTSSKDKNLEEKNVFCADVTSIAPIQQQNNFSNAWQARSASKLINMPNTKNVAPQSRFGPKSIASNNIEQPNGELSSKNDTTENVPMLDGYKLGYRANPQRNPQNRQTNVYHNNNYRSNNQYSGYKPPRNYSNDNQSYRSNYSTPNNLSSLENQSDNVYHLTRDAEFIQMPIEGQLPKLMQLEGTQNAKGYLEIMPEGYGFLRDIKFGQTNEDCWVSNGQIKRYHLRNGDLIEGIARFQRVIDNYPALLVVEKVNSLPADEVGERLRFEQLTPISPNKRIPVESKQNSKNVGVRLIDLVMPIGYGQRGLIVSSVDTNLFFILKGVFNSLRENDPSAKIMLLLLDLPPEEETEIREELDAEIFVATIADSAEVQIKTSERMLDRAMRLVERGENVILFVDSLTKLTKAYQNNHSQGNKPITTSVSSSALIKPKKLFGMARNTKEAGSLTVLAKIDVGTNSRVDEIIFEEFKGKANMELHLIPSNENSPITPMVNLINSQTKKENLLLDSLEAEGLNIIRKLLAQVKNEQAVTQLVDMIKKTKCNTDLLTKLPKWYKLLEKNSK